MTIKADCLEHSDLAEKDFFETKINIMDFCSFVGFPGNEHIKWWDLDGQPPISRISSIASLPEKSFYTSGPQCKPGADALQLPPVA